MNGSRSAAMTGGRIAFRTAITAAATSAVPNAFTSAPGTIQTATSSAKALSTQETSRRTGRNFGRIGPQTGCSPYVVVVIMLPSRRVGRVLAGEQPLSLVPLREPGEH